MSGARLKSQVVVPARTENLHNDDSEEGEITSPHSDHTPPGSRSQSRSRSGSQSRSASPAVVGDLDYAIQLQQYTRHREQQERRQEQRRERRQDNQRRSQERRRDRSQERRRDKSQERCRDRSQERRRDRSQERRRDRSQERCRDRSQERRRDRSRERRREDRRGRDRHHDGGRRRSSSPKQSADTSGRTSDQPREAGGAVQREPRAAAAADPSLTTRTGGAYIPPARLRLMQQQITDKSSVAYQRLAWEALKKSLNGLVNKVNVANLVQLVPELLAENVVRGRGLLCRAVLQAQAASPTFTHVYAALIAIVNSKFPQIGELLLHRLVLQFKRGFRRNDKPLCMSACRFIAHLVNFQVAHEVLALEVLTLLLESPTDDSVEVAVSFLEQAGHKLAELSPRGVAAIFEQLRHILHQAHVDTRVQYMIEVAFAVRKDGFKSFPSMLPELDQVDEDDQFTHMVALDDTITNQEMLNVFRHDPDYEDNEQKYAAIRQELLGDDSASDNDGGGGGGGGSDDDDQSDSRHTEADDDDDDDETAPIVDSTEQVLRSLRQTIYLAIQSSLDFEETAHKLLRLQLKPGQEVELCHMIIDCCAQERSYLKFFGLLAERFCNYNRKYQEHFETIFAATYDTVHRLETVKLRNVAKLYSHLLHSDAISWAVLQHVRLNEQDTTSSSRIFVKICFQELCEFMGLVQLCRRVADPTLSIALEGLFPRDNPINTRFAINFFSAIGLGGLTEGLRDHLKSQPKPTAVVAPMTADRCPQPPSAPSHSDSCSTSSASSSSDSSSSDSSSSDSSSSSSGGSDRKSKKKSRHKRQSRAKHASKKAPAKSKKRSVRSERGVSSRKKSRRA